MRKNPNTKMNIDAMAEALKSVMGETEVENLARDTGILRRKRTLIPHAFILALLASLGIGKVSWIADILRAYNALTGFSLQYKPFHNQLGGYRARE
jgi:hypothetical protein